MKITVFSDYICPFCYIGLETLRKVRSEVPPFTLEWKGFQIHPEYPATGVPMERRMAQYGKERYEALWRKIQALAADIDLDMRRPPLLTNSLPALEATEYAKEHGKDSEFWRAVYRAYFHEGKNIGDIDIVLTIATAVGLDGQKLREHLQAGTYLPRMRSFQQEAQTLGVSGVPTFIVGPAQIVGAQTPDVFVSVLRRVAERGLA